MNTVIKFIIWSFVFIFAFNYISSCKSKENYDGALLILHDANERKWQKDHPDYIITVR
jgi:hypothetical protein